MRVTIDPAARDELDALPKQLRSALIDTLTNIAEDPAQLERSAVVLQPEEANELDLPSISADKPIKAIGVKVMGERSRTGSRSVRIYFTTSVDAVNVLALSSMNHAAIA